MALQTKEFVGTTGRPTLWTWKIIASEESADLKSKTSVVKIQSYIGRNSSAGGSYFRGTATLRYAAGGQQYDGWYENWTDVNISAGGWYKIGERSFTVSNTGTKTSPTKITVSGALVEASFSPTTGSASGELTLTPLHEPPTFESVTFEETNQQLVNLEVGDNYFVSNLSVKNVTIKATTSDGATITKYEIINGGKTYDSATDVVAMDFQKNPLGTVYLDYLGRDVAELTIRVTDDLGGVMTVAYPDTYVIPYTKPSIEKTSTSIKRKTGGGVTLTDNKAVLNFIGNCYKGNDVIGNNNTPKVQYKIWETTEPTNYTSLTTPNVASITIKDYEISNLDYLKVYKYKIKIYDTFTTAETTINVKEDKVPTGVSVWTEYPDRVDFIKATIDGNDIVKQETIDGWEVIKFYNGTAICSLNYDYTLPNSWESWGSMYASAGVAIPDYPITFIETPTTVFSMQRISGSYNGWLIAQEGSNSSVTNCGHLQLIRPTNPNTDFAIGIRIIAIGKWK